MLFHSKARLREPVIVTEVFREDGTMMGKKMGRSNKFLGIVHAIRFTDGDQLVEEYRLFNITKREHEYRDEDGKFIFKPNENWYPSGFITKVSDVLYSYRDPDFRFLSESINNTRWTNPDLMLARTLKEQYPKEKLEELMEDLKVYNII